LVFDVGYDVVNFDLCLFCGFGGGGHVGFLFGGLLSCHS
jgi:hypothetical protein